MVNVILLCGGPPPAARGRSMRADAAAGGRVLPRKTGGKEGASTKEKECRRFLGNMYNSYHQRFFCGPFFSDLHTPKPQKRHLHKKVLIPNVQFLFSHGVFP